MKNLIKLFIFIGILSLASCAKEEMPHTGCIDQYGNVVACENTCNTCDNNPNSEPDYVCVDEFDNEVQCPDGTFIMDGIVFIPTGNIMASAIVTRSQPVESGNGWIINACQTYRQTFKASDGFYEDFIMDAEGIQINISDETALPELSGNGLKELLVDESNNLIQIMTLNGPAGTPCTNMDAWIDAYE